MRNLNLDTAKGQEVSCVKRCKEVSLYIKVLFHIFYYYWGKEIHSLLRYIEVRWLYGGSTAPTFTNCNQGDG